MLGDRLLCGTSALLLALTVVWLPASGVIASSARAPHECTDHACFCRRPATGSPAAPCHGDSDKNGARMTATCHHDTNPVQVAAIRPGVLPPRPPLLRADGSRALPPGSSRPPAAGFRTVESPPPQPTRSSRA